MVAPLTFHRVTELPAQPIAGGIYFVAKSPSEMETYVVGEDGIARHRPANVLYLAFGGPGKPRDGQEIGRLRVVETLDWAAVISGATAESPATAPADVLLTRLDGTLIARFRWLAGSSEAQVSVISPTSAPGDVLILTAPTPQDATLAGIAGTLAGLRRIA